MSTNFQFLSVQGIFGSFLGNTIHTWAIRMKGPVYVAMFKPLAIVIAVAMGVAILGDSLYLGRYKLSLYAFLFSVHFASPYSCCHGRSVIGATIISIGFYTVMWGKAQDEMVEDSAVDRLESPSARKAPLLQSYKTEV